MSLQVDIQHSQGAFDLALRFECGAGITALFGRSGAGKTTLIDLIAGLRRPQQGRIAVAGRVLVDTAQGIFLPPHKRSLGYVFQEARLFPHLDVRSNLLYGRRFADGLRLRHDGFDETVAMLGLEPLLARRPGKLSGGEKQRVAIGRALLARPRLLLMDEPLASLDAARKAEILPYIERLRDAAKIPIVYVSHALPEVMRLADHLVLLGAGRVQADGKPAELAARLDLPLLGGGEDAGALLEGSLVDHLPAHGLSRVRSQAGDLLLPKIDLPAGSMLKLRIPARDVTLFLQPPEGSSALNLLRGRVVEMLPHGDTAMDVRLDCNGVALLARITRYSAERMQLAPGAEVCAAIKSVAMDRG
ncbi:molybdenum ABC transporter ATP-binding protein [Ferrovibrio sp.]|uniref:molybdenum ABC transporter ATP-binding protein n=1 Tax=Ferrovibrio sp. TaxID=1917215 RepID=UPI0025C35139|nr:molybdenum ABC transporter ATP-binding protein [Ferrovibrio sp.]MBX3453544.1 molybdenum ABC transporter ATP-binding protein [Ferrovibrio sp.]